MHDPQPRQIIPALTNLLTVLSTSAHERTVQQLFDVVAAQSAVIQAMMASNGAHKLVVQDSVQILQKLQNLQNLLKDLEQAETQRLLQWWARLMGPESGQCRFG